MKIINGLIILLSITQITFAQSSYKFKLDVGSEQTIHLGDTIDLNGRVISGDKTKIDHYQWEKYNTILKNTSGDEIIYWNEQNSENEYKPNELGTNILKFEVIDTSGKKYLKRLKVNVQPKNNTNPISFRDIKFDIDPQFPLKCQAPCEKNFNYYIDVNVGDTIPLSGIVEASKKSLVSSYRWEDNGTILKNKLGDEILYFDESNRENDYVVTKPINKLLDFIVTDINGKETKRSLLLKVNSDVESPIITINEVLVLNSNTNFDPDFKEYSGWVELYNHTDTTIDLSNYSLSNDSNNPLKWEIPSGSKIKPKEYMLIWMDKEDDIQKALHTNFKMSYKGETLSLYNFNETLIDSITFPKQKANISCAKVTNKIVYMKPTPNMPNGKTFNSSKRANKPTMSLKSGFYNGTQHIKLSQKKGGTIYYTTNGSIPTKLSKKYSGEFTVSKTTVVRAIALESGKFKSKVSNSTYLINENITLPVVSIAINDEYLNDNKIGIYKNYTERWMRAGSIEYIKDGVSKFSQNVGIRLSGGQTRAYAQKSLAIFAKARFGKKSIKYKLFPDKKNIKKVKSFVLRNSGNDWGYSMMKDGLVHSIVKDNMDIDYQSYHPTVTFINGKYWGIYNIREKTNEDYIEANHGVDSKKIDLLKGDEYEVKSGSNDDYLKLLSYIKDNPLANNSNYNHVKSKINIDEYINYMITETYVGNIDWLYNNIKCWKEQSSQGKWRWILYDTDNSFDEADFDSIAFVLEENGPAVPNPPYTTFLFRNLMKNATFKEKFISSYISHLNTTFKPSRINNIITKMKNTIKPEIQRHFNRWERVSSEDWETGDIERLRVFALNRAGEMKRLLATHFTLNGKNKP